VRSGDWRGASIRMQKFRTPAAETCRWAAWLHSSPTNCHPYHRVAPQTNKESHHTVNDQHTADSQPGPLQEITAQDVLKCLFPESQLMAIVPLAGSDSNATYLVKALSADDNEIAIVVRRYKIFYHYDRAEKARREYRLFTLLYHSEIPVPEPLLLDDSGSILGSPGIVTRYVPGTLDLTPSDPSAWASEIARILAAIHRVPGASFDTGFLLNAHTEALWFFYPDTGIPDYMAAHPQGEAVWSALERLVPTLQVVPPSIVHLDYWSGQLLWRDGRIVAVVDWEEVAYGDPAIDVAYFRMDMVLSGKADVADIFLHAYEQAVGQSVANLGFWELAASVRPMFHPEGWVSDSPFRERFTQFIDAALLRSGS
jgi:aminoglycoside phosphotransferase (APT) family kinase protein